MDIRLTSQIVQHRLNKYALFQFVYCYIVLPQINSIIKYNVHLNSQQHYQKTEMYPKGRGSLKPTFGPSIWLKNENWLKSIIL